LECGCYVVTPAHFASSAITIINTTTSQSPANSCELLRNPYRINKIEKNKTIQINPDLTYLEMVEGGKYNVENWTIVCMGATCTLTKIATICPQTS
jgi:hypothetical protein